MTADKILKFFETAIYRTKAGNLVWSMIDPLVTLEFPTADQKRSYLARHGRGVILLIRDNFDFIRCMIKPDNEFGYSQIGEDNDPNLLRLYNIVYSQFPSVDSFVDDFISGY